MGSNGKIKGSDKLILGRQSGAYADLHVHSYSSFDGLYKIQELLDIFVRSGLSLASITDHNTIKAMTDLYDFCKKSHIDAYLDWNGIKFVPGTEVTCRVSAVPNKKGNSTKVHALVYSPNLSPDSPLHRLLGYKRRNDKDVDYGLLIHICKKKNIVKLDTEEEKLQFEEGLREFIVNKRKVDKGFSTFGLSQALEFLEEKGWFGTFVKSHKELFELYETAPKFERLDIELEDLIKIAHASNGLVIMAHPSTNLKRTDTPELLIEHMVKIGLDGFEIVGEKKTYKDMILDTIDNLDPVNPIIYTGGSDTHDLSEGNTIGIKHNNIISKTDVLKFEDWLMAEFEARKKGEKSIRNWTVDLEEVEDIIAKYRDRLVAINSDALRITHDKEDHFSHMTDGEQRAWESSLPRKIATLNERKEEKQSEKPVITIPQTSQKQSKKDKKKDKKKKREYDFSDDNKKIEPSQAYLDYIAEMEAKYGEDQNYTYNELDDDLINE